MDDEDATVDDGTFPPMNIGFPRDLPVEVLDIIASHLDYDDLRAFNLCSRLLYGVACRHLWEDVGLRITDDERARTVLAGILATKRLHSFIRLCGIDVCIPRLSDNCLGLLARLLAACPLLGCLSLSGPEDSADDPVSLSTAVVAAIGAAPNLRILFLQHVAFTGRWPSRFGSVAARCLLLRGPVAKLARLLQYTAEASYLDLDDAACVAASRHCVVAGNATLRLPQTVALSLGFSGLVDPHDAIKALQGLPSIASECKGLTLTVLEAEQASALDNACFPSVTALRLASRPSIDQAQRLNPLTFLRRAFPRLRIANVIFRISLPNLMHTLDTMVASLPPTTIFLALTIRPGQRHRDPADRPKPSDERVASLLASRRSPFIVNVTDALTGRCLLRYSRQPEEWQEAREWCSSAELGICDEHTDHRTLPDELFGEHRADHPPAQF